MSDIWQRQSKLYQRLKLIPLDEFIETTVRENLQRFRKQGSQNLYPPRDEVLYRQIGGTTWMCVRALLALEDGKSVTLIGRTKQEGNRIGHLLLLLYKRLGGEIASSTLDTATLDTGCTVRWIGLQSIHAARGEVFNDVEWGHRTVRRAKGPFHMIHEVRAESHRGLTIYNAYAEDDELLMEVPLETAQMLPGKLKVSG